MEERQMKTAEMIGFLNLAVAIPKIPVKAARIPTMMVPMANPPSRSNSAY